MSYFETTLATIVVPLLVIGGAIAAAVAIEWIDHYKRARGKR